MTSLKEGGTNIGNWSFEELEEIVQSFIKIQKQKEAVREYESFKDPKSSQKQEYDSGDDEYGDTKSGSNPSKQTGKGMECTDIRFTGLTLIQRLVTLIFSM